MGKYISHPGLKAIDVRARKIVPAHSLGAFITFVEKGGGMLGFAPRSRRFQAQPLFLVKDLAQWVKVDPFEPPLDGSDAGFSRVLQEFKAHVSPYRAMGVLP
jgi:hypothetical protein